MNKIQTILIFGCMALADFCFAQAEPYAVIDLSGGPLATSYPVSYAAVTDNGWTNGLTYKTNKLVMRRIEQPGVGGTNYIGVFEVTNGQWKQVTGSDFGGVADFPMASRTYVQMESFITTLKTKTGLNIAFPTEAQWEFACRAGTTTDYFYGSNSATPLPNYAWFSDNSGGASHAVGLKSPNPWGIYDLYGNVDEICLGAPVPPLRGGYYSDAAAACTSASRSTDFPGSSPQVGFRILAKVPQLTVIGGTGGGYYTNGTAVSVSATAGPYNNFVKWLVDPATAGLLGPGFVETRVTNTVIMPFVDVTLTASNTPAVLYVLTVIGGMGSGSYTNGHVVSLTAAPPGTGDTFERWLGDTNTVTDIFASSTTLVMPSTNVVVNATYRHDPVTYYVDASRHDDGGAATNWATAKKSIQAALALAVSRDTVLVTNGIYNSGTVATPGGALNNRVVITNNVAVRSVNGPSVTAIQGSGFLAYGTVAAIRCVYMSNGTLTGFTLENGATFDSAQSALALNNGGGGAFMTGSVTVVDCVIRNSKAYNGGGAFGGSLAGCTLAMNWASQDGGGVFQSALTECALSGNAAASFGGGSYDANLSRCWLSENTAEAGGGSFGGAQNNCLYVDNTAGSGGGVCDGSLDNCTLSGNMAFTGGGAYESTLRNCIAWENTKQDGSVDNCYGGTLRYSCAFPLASGLGNIASDPLFMDPNDLRLRTESPCVDRGSNAYGTGLLDILGNPRVRNDRVDMGAYEVIPLDVVVTFDSQGGTAPSFVSKTVAYGSVYGTLATTTRTGCTFSGWFTNAACTGASVISTTTVSIPNAHTLYAKWSEQATTTMVPVPYSWLNQYPTLMFVAGGNHEIAALIDVDLDGMLTWQEYVAGSNPTNQLSVLRSLIDMSNGIPQLTWTPDLGTARVYSVLGSTNLTDSAWGPTNAATRFYRVRVDME